MAGTIPTTIESLSTTAASNDPTEGSGAAMTLVNDGLRAAYAFVRQTVTAGSDIASASTITPPSTGSSFNLTGTTTVTAIGSTNSWDGRIVWFRHTGAHSFTNSATLVCLGGSSITFASGDLSAWRQRTSGTWDQVVYSKASALPVYAGGTASLGNTTVSGTLAAGNTTITGAFAAGSSGSQWQIDSSNRLLNSGNTQPHAFALSPNSRTTTGTFAAYATELVDQGSNFNATTGTYTSPIAQKVLVAAIGYHSTSSGSGYAEIVIRKNGSGITLAQPLVLSATANSFCLISGTSLAVSDTIDVTLSTITGTGATVAVLGLYIFSFG